MSHRAILCANTDGKNIAKMERAQVLDTIEDELSSVVLLQCGGMRGRGTDIANVLVRAVFATQACRDTSGAGVYVDVVSAFYSIIREYLIPRSSSDEAIAHMFYTLGLDPQAVHHFADMLADPPVVTQAGVPD